MNTTVLVVEDDLEINELLGEYLSLENIKYLQATTGQGGIHQATTQHPDALVLDLMLPDIDGFEVARTLSSQRATCDIPIIILSCMCQEGDREKGYGSGALFYMNKPFLPDDLLATLREALDWKASLRTRTPGGVFTLGSAKVDTACGEVCDAISIAKALNQMTTELFVRTELAEPVVGRIREAFETLNQWSRQWNDAHPKRSRLKVEYGIGPAVNGEAAAANGVGATIEWKLSEDVPGILAEAFFKPVNGAPAGAVAGWGAGSLVTKPLAPIAPPAEWLQVLAKTGAARFEKDTRTQTVRFTRPAGGEASYGAGHSSSAGANGGPGGGGCMVPVVEIDGFRIPTRVRDEALAARRK